MVMKHAVCYDYFGLFSLKYVTDSLISTFGNVCVRERDFCTWDAFAFDSLGDDCKRLVAGLTQHLTQLLHTVAIHNDGVPAGKTEEIKL